MPLLPIAEMLLQYAVSDHDNYMSYGQQSGMIALDVQSGKVNEVNTTCDHIFRSAVLA